MVVSKQRPKGLCLFLQVSLYVLGLAFVHPLVDNNHFFQLVMSLVPHQSQALLLQVWGHMLACLKDSDEDGSEGSN